MKKSYFLKFKSKMLVNDLLALFEKKFDIDFLKYESEYLGEYYSYKGLFCDSFKLLYNKLPDGDLQFNDADIFSVIKLSFYEGKNKEKESRCLYMKNQLENMECLIFDSFEIFEE